MAFHIVTNRCFLSCERVVAVVLEDVFEEKTTKSKAKTKKTPQKVLDHCTIEITYSPITTNNSSYNGENSLQLRVSNKAHALSLYAEIVKQVQEQFPSEVFLDKLVEKMLGGDGEKCEMIEDPV